MKEQNKRKSAGTGKSPGQKKPADPKLIRLDDLVSRQDVRGGGKTFFGSK